MRTSNKPCSIRKSSILISNLSPMACELPDIPYCENCQTKFISKCPKNRKKSVKKLNIRTKTYREPFLKPELRYNFTCPLFEVDYNLYEFFALSLVNNYDFQNCSFLFWTLILPSRCWTQVLTGRQQFFSCVELDISRFFWSWFFKIRLFIRFLPEDR